jgi:hypothetical protein
LQKNRNHPKIYFGKWHHSAHIDWHDNSFKDTCPPDSANDFRNADYQFWALNNLRHTSVLHGDWNWGKATAPNYIDVCSYYSADINSSKSSSGVKLDYLK